MKKYLALIALIACVAVSLCGCNQDDKEEVRDCAQPSFYTYHFGEACGNVEVFIQIKSFEISDSYGDTVATEDNESGSGYYVILGVNTDLIEHDFTHPKNEVYLTLEAFFPIYEGIDLEFVLFDPENKKLVYEITYDERIDYEQLCSLKPTDGDDERNSITSPAFVMELMCFKGESFRVENVLHFGKRIVIELAPE